MTDELTILRLCVMNKASLRNLISATSLVILLKLDPNRQFFSPCDLIIWRLTFENNRASFLNYIKLFASFQSHGWIQTWVTVRKRSIQVKIGDFLFRVTYLEIWQMTLKNNRAPPLCCFNLCSSLPYHQWIPTGVATRKLPIWVKIDDFLAVWPWN